MRLVYPLVNIVLILLVTSVKASASLAEGSTTIPHESIETAAKSISENVSNDGALVSRDRNVVTTDKFLLISTLDGVLHAIDQTSGIIKWSLQLGSPIVSIYKVNPANDEASSNNALDSANKVPFITVDKLPPGSSEPSFFIGKYEATSSQALSNSQVHMKLSSGERKELTLYNDYAVSRPVISPVTPDANSFQDQNADLNFFLSVSMYFYTALAGSCVTIIVFLLFYRRFLTSRIDKQPPIKKLIPPPLANSENVTCVGKIAFDSKEIIGKGSAGTCVYKGWFEGTTAIAVKRVITEHFTLAQREIDLLRQLHHPNVVRYFATESDSSFKYIAIELAEFSLADFIERRSSLMMNGDNIISTGHASDPYSSLDSLYILESSCNGLNHLHHHNVIHRDLKPQNILICKTASGAYKVLISDFGVSKTISSDASAASMSHEFISTTRVLKGTDGWIAPEVIKGKFSVMSANNVSTSSDNSFSSSNSDFKSCKQMDIFSMGCLFYYVFTNGHHPFGDHPVERQSNIINNKFVLDNLDDEKQIGERTLISSMIAPDPSERPSITSILSHPLFWSKSKRLQFIQDVSDRIERELINSEISMTLEKGRWDVIRGDWQRHLPQEIQYELTNHRSYRSSSVSSLLRAIRNKRHHYRELSDEVKQILGSVPDGFMSFFDTLYPRLIYHCYIAMQSFKDEPLFRDYYDQNASWDFSFPSLPSTGIKYFNLPPANSPSSSSSASTAKRKSHRNSKNKKPSDQEISLYPNSEWKMNSDYQKLMHDYND